MPLSFSSPKTGPLLLFGALLLVVALFFYWRVAVEDEVGDYHVRAGNYRLEDGQFKEALAEFGLALEKNPGHALAHLGLAIALMQSGRDDEALAAFDRTIALKPDLAVAYANKGILLDRLGDYPQALAHYQKALALEPKVAEGPGWLWRFLRNLDEKPPTVADRAAYLEQELQKTAAEQLLRLPEQDVRQRMYRLD